MAPRTLTIELTPELEAALEGARRTQALASDEEAAARLILQNSVSPEEQERRRAILRGIRGILPSDGKPYDAMAKAEMFAGMDV